jgi:hypothetical protein
MHSGTSKARCLLVCEALAAKFKTQMVYFFFHPFGHLVIPRGCTLEMRPLVQVWRFVMVFGVALLSFFSDAFIVAVL